MRIKEGYVMNKLGDGYVVVAAVGEASNDFNGVIRALTLPVPSSGSAFRTGQTADRSCFRQWLSATTTLMKSRRRGSDDFLEKIAFTL